MRAKNIFKADKGIKCPFCRQYVDGYRSTLTANAAVQRFLLEANKAANIAAAARAAAERKAMGQQGPAPAAAAAASSAGSSSSSAAAASGGLRPPSAGASAAAAAAGEDQTWNCGGCGRQNFIWREFCSHCKRPCANPYATDKLSQTKKDLSAVSREELVGYIRDQGGFSLRKGLRDMGVSIDGQKSYGSVQSVREATAMFGLKRVLHIAEMLCDPDALRDASLHYLGNIGVQRVFESLAKLRLAFPPDRPNKDMQEWTAAHGGRDPFACLLSALLARSLEFCMHDKGVYVAQCAANLASNAELVEMAKAVFPLALPVSRDPRGVFVLLSLLDLFSQRIWEDTVNCSLALQAVDLLCNQFSCSDKQLVHTCHHALSGKVVVRAIAVSMPRTPALKLAIKIASHAATLAGSGGGLTTLMELMQLYGHNQQAAEGLRDVVTMMCYSLQGQMGRFATSKDEAAQEMLLCLVERLGHEQEVGWLDSIAQELVGCADALQDNPGGMEILKFTLSQPCMDLDNISAHISDMKHLLGKKALLPVVADVMERVGANPLPPAAPKYPAASVIQPELKYYLSQGWRTPLPPPPPPKAGEPGYEEYAAQAAARAEAQAAAAAKARAEKEAAAKARREAAAAAAASATLTWLHTIFTTIGMIAMAAVGFFEIKRVPVSKSLPVATVYVGFIVLNNLSIQLNTVGFYQISKIAITPVVVAIEWAFYSKPASPRILASIAVLLTGITLATVTDSQVSSRPLGMLVAAINVCVTGLYQVWAGSKQRELGLNGLQLLHQVAPLSVALLAVMIPLLEPVGFTNPGPDTVLGYTLTPGAAFWIIVSSMLGLVVTLSTFLFIGATSSLTYNVVGHMKTVLIVAGGVLLFGDSMSAKKLAGLGCAMAGIVWYSQIKLGEASKAGKQ
ncbi:hypothetical protein OEZ85_014030 [Tetradesmus obliquus]|uniref:RanBP2-type domain-containing protein n=1 Tax=Tetradesmus obliquus TaxID=3088 RepID=A0ABY8U904_TETOB|nr:hypothetical protein OEZ85_014030 [Tetradesmus obliquus]